jgi:hypothetical protein
LIEEEEEDFNSAPIFTPGEPLIFLDIDGVLTRHNYDLVAQSNVIESGLVQILNIVLLATNCKIVLSSAWRYITYRNEANIVGLDWLFRSHGMAARRLVDVTGQDTMVPHFDGITHNFWPLENERGRQIRKWLDIHDPKKLSNYVVIDDGGFHHETKIWNDLGILACRHPVVWTHPTTGITHTNAALAMEILCGNPRVSSFQPSPMVGRSTHESLYFLPHKT